MRGDGETEPARVYPQTLLRARRDETGCLRKAPHRQADRTFRLRSREPVEKRIIRSVPL